MNSETKICQNCKNQFTVFPEDFVFYERIKMPAPTWCPQCRNQRRMSWRNERSLYKHKCGAPGHSEEVISMYHSDAPYVVYDRDYWWGDAWDPLSYGLDYDFNKTFFEQFVEFHKTVPQIALANMNSVQSDYVNYSDGNKNCYLIFGGGWNENVRYSNKMMENKDSQDLYVAGKNQLCYECINCNDSYRLLYSLNCKSCTDSAFLYACRSCTNCFGCANLISKSYCIFNQQYTKEEYEQKLKEFNLQSRRGVQKAADEFYKNIYLKAIHRYANIIGSVNCSGDNINNSKNCQYCFDLYRDVEDSKYQFSSIELKDAYDGNGIYKNELSYEISDANVGNRNWFDITIYASDNVQYSIDCHSSSYLFGCLGLRSKKYCILNKQYTKEEYEHLVPKIIEQMKAKPYIDKRGRVYPYGEFFPMDLSPHSYNDTIAQEYYSLTPEQAKSEQLSWREPQKKTNPVTLTVEDIPDSMQYVSEEIIKENIGCLHKGECLEQCTVAFRITKPEFEFYKQLHIPLPQLCPNCRHHQRVKKRNPTKLWHRACMCDNVRFKNTVQHHHGVGPCKNEFETSYDIKKPEIIYCEACYQAEVS